MAIRAIASEIGNKCCSINLEFSQNIEEIINQISSGHRECGLIAFSTIHCKLNTVTQDFSGCRCDLVVDKDGGKIFIATTAYKNVKNTVKNGVRLISMMPRNTKSNL